jgi:GcrA cell cycle regulator
MGWTDERIALLTKYWQEGRSASQIAEALGEGLTRNAVIGKAHRLGLASRPSPLKGGDGGADEAPRARKKAEPAAAAAAAPVAAGDAKPAAVDAMVPVDLVAAPVVEPSVAAPAPQAAARKETKGATKGAAKGSAKPARVTLLDLNDRICKWPIGHPDEPDFHFCGKPVSPGFPYCGEHCLVAYQSQQPRRDRPAGPPPPFRPNLPRVR